MATETVYSNQDPLMVHHIKNLLDQEGIPCVLEQLHLQAAMGELPLLAWPRLVVPNGTIAQRARTIIKLALEPGPSIRGLWICEACGESIEQPLDTCWNCGVRRGERRPTKD